MSDFVTVSARRTFAVRLARAVVVPAALTSVLALTACGQQQSGSDCQKLMRFNDVTYSSANGEVSGLDRPIGVAVNLDCNDTVESPYVFEAEELQVWGLKNVEPDDAVAVILSADNPDADQAILYIPGEDPCDISPTLLARIKLVGSGPCDFPTD